MADIRYNPALELPSPRRSPFVLNQIVFMPGINSISEADYQSIQELKEYKERLETGAFAIVEPIKPAKKTTKTQYSDTLTLDLGTDATNVDVIKSSPKPKRTRKPKNEQQSDPIDATLSSDGKVKPEA